NPRSYGPHAGQEMGGLRRADRDRALFGAVRCRGRDATFVYYDCDRAHRRHARPPGADAPHGDDCRAGGAFLSPDAVVHPSFQMSFAATLALIAAYAYGQPLARAGANSPLATRAALWGVNEIVSLLLASLIAGLATTPYAAYHFHRLAPFGVVANLLA